MFIPSPHRHNRLSMAFTFRISLTITFGPREEKEATKGAEGSAMVSLFSMFAVG